MGRKETKITEWKTKYTLSKDNVTIYLEIDYQLSSYTITDYNNSSALVFDGNIRENIHSTQYNIDVANLIIEALKLAESKIKPLIEEDIGPPL